MKNKAENNKKFVKGILLGSALLAGTGAAFAAASISKNVRSMNVTLSGGMRTITENAKIRPLDPGKYQQIALNKAVKFNVSQYEICGIGNLSVMKVNVGVMQMLSFIITPFEKEMPILSADYMYMLGKRMAYTEFYDTVSSKDSEEYREVIDQLRSFALKYSYLEDVRTTPSWQDDMMSVVLHKSGKPCDDPVIYEMFCDAVSIYLEAAAKLPQLTQEERKVKCELNQKFTDRLISQGGISTDMFKKAIGSERTKDFFDKVLFGTEIFGNK